MLGLSRGGMQARMSVRPWTVSFVVFARCLQMQVRARDDDIQAQPYCAVLIAPAC
jgi:hypothetical protein